MVAGVGVDPGEGVRRIGFWGWFCTSPWSHLNASQKVRRTAAWLLLAIITVVGVAVLMHFVFPVVAVAGITATVKFAGVSVGIAQLVMAGAAGSMVLALFCCISAFAGWSRPGQPRLGFYVLLALGALLASPLLAAGLLTVGPVAAFAASVGGAIVSVAWFSGVPVLAATLSASALAAWVALSIVFFSLGQYAASLVQLDGSEPPSYRNDLSTAKMKNTSPWETPDVQFEYQAGALQEWYQAAGVIDPHAVAKPEDVKLNAVDAWLQSLAGDCATASAGAGKQAIALSMTTAMTPVQLSNLALRLSMVRRNLHSCQNPPEKSEASKKDELRIRMDPKTLLINSLTRIVAIYDEMLQHQEASPVSGHDIKGKGDTDSVAETQLDANHEIFVAPGGDCRGQEAFAKASENSSSGQESHQGHGTASSGGRS